MTCLNCNQPMTNLPSTSQTSHWKCNGCGASYSFSIAGTNLSSGFLGQSLGSFLSPVASPQPCPVVNAAGEPILCLMYWDEARACWNRCQEEHLRWLAAGGLKPEQIASIPYSDPGDQYLQSARGVARYVLRNPLSAETVANLEAAYPWLLES